MTTILAVDDSATMRKCLEITFAGSEFDLVTVESAAEALEKVKTASPDLVITDVSLPPNDGYELCSTIKLAAPQLPVLMLSSKQHPFDPTRGAQADSHIDKPFDTQVMQDKARAMVKAKVAMETDKPPAVRPAAAQAPTAPDRSGASKIPAPQRKRPTPAMLAKPQISTKKQSAAANVRRTVPFAMPGASKRPEISDAGSTGTQPMGGAAPARTGPTMTDTLPGGTAASETATAPAVEISPVTTAPATAAPITAGSAPAGGVAMSPQAAQDLNGKLQGLGLTADQVNGVLSLSRDLVEQVVWEVVPVLAETLIKEELRRLTKA